MPFKKGDKNINRKGRPVGQTYSGKLRHEITTYCETNLAYYLDELKAMRTGQAKINGFLSLLNYALPKLTESNSVVDINNLSESDIDSLFNKLLDNEKPE